LVFLVPPDRLSALLGEALDVPRMEPVQDVEEKPD
jgi:hypothetical protein